MNKQELISMYERISNFSENASTKKVIANLRKLDEPQACHADVTPRYLRNVIARLRELPLHDREVWLKAIMDEFEEDFSHSKWREGYEQGKSEGAWVGQQLKDADKIRRELNRPIVPQFVAEIIEYYKRNNATLYDALREKNFNKQYSEWLLNEQNAYDKVAKAWLDGYEVEKEKRYLVKMKGVHPGSVYLKRQTEDDYWYFGVNSENKCIAIKHTRKELEEAGFGEVFNSLLFEVEEVEG
jgi:hypothetical protein|nr:MAG TPA: Protein of unknown function (DUF1642) [Caudoviricetes sp.]